jgi:hypothetical protein
MPETETAFKLDLEGLILKGIANAKGSPQNIENLREEDISALGKLCVERESQKHFLKHVTDVTMKSCAAGRSLAQAGKKFPGFHDGGFKNWNLDEKQTAGTELPLSVYEMQNGKDGTFKTIFESLNRPLADMMVKQNRIEQFVDDHADLLHPQDYVTMFLIERESDKEVFVVNVEQGNSGLEIYVYEFGDDDVLFGKCCHRVVVPAKVA